MRGYLGNQARNRQGGGGGNKGGGGGNRPSRGGNNGGQRHPRHELPQDDFVDGDDIGIISPKSSRLRGKSMNLST